MKAIILAGGLGTRLSEETQNLPKPMVRIGEYPMLWHIMKIYSAHGINDFVVCAGYKSDIIIQYFRNYHIQHSDVTFNIRDNTHIVHNNVSEDWRVTVVRTGVNSMTGGRLKRVYDFVKDDPFCMTYGDGLSDVDIAASIAFHKGHGKLATVTAVSPPGRFGQLEVTGTEITDIIEKPQNTASLINGGFFVLEPEALDVIDDDSTIWERKPMETLVARGEMQAFLHNGFWQPMDTLREKNYLEELWRSGEAPWKVW